MCVYVYTLIGISIKIRASLFSPVFLKEIIVTLYQHELSFNQHVAVSVTWHHEGML